MSNFRRYYQNNNIVFITIVTYNRNPILIENIDILRNAFKAVKYEYKIIAGIVLPDHIHLLIQTKNSEDFPKIIKSVKVNFSQNFPFNELQTSEQKQRREKGIWQRKYYDHIIRDEDDLYKHLDYIHFNSMKHLNIKPVDWEFSSFNKYVLNGYYEKNWCNFNDNHNIANMNLE